MRGIGNGNGEVQVREARASGPDLRWEAPLLRGLRKKGVAEEMSTPWLDKPFNLPAPAPDLEKCEVYSTGTHECWTQVFCGKCSGGAKYCQGCH